MAEILIWVAVAVAVLAVWLLAGRTSDDGGPRRDDHLPPPDTTMRGGMF